MMPLGLLECIVSWFSSHLSEDEYKAILNTIKMGNLECMGHLHLCSGSGFGQVAEERSLLKYFHNTCKNYSIAKAIFALN